MKKIPFFKMSGCGNDFIIIDNRSNILNGMDIRKLARTLCERRVSVGADGLILIECATAKSDFSWKFFNADGSQAEMCGNGGRCTARYAVIRGITREKLSFETPAGVITAEVSGKRVKIQLPEPKDYEMNIALKINGVLHHLHFINTGVPHVVKFVDEIDDITVKELGRKIRFHPYFQPAGTNVNFVTIQPNLPLLIRTYERGVEAETLACGTGSVAAALIASSVQKIEPPARVKTKSGEILTVYMQNPSPPFGRVYLEGDVNVVCEGDIWDEAYRKE